MAEKSRITQEIADGSSTAPSLAFGTDSDVGIYKVSSNTLGIVAPNTIRLNSVNFSNTSDSIIGFQSKPAANATTTGNVIGCEISPRANSGVGVGSIIGAHIDAYLKGTAAGGVTDVRALQLELVTDDAGTRNISGYVCAIRVRMAFSAGTVTGQRTVFRIESPEAQTNSETYDAVFDFTNTVAGVWNNAPTTEPSVADGYIKVRMNGTNRYIQLYSTAPTD